MSTENRRVPFWAPEPIDAWQAHRSNRDLRELAPNVYGPARLHLDVHGWRGLNLALDVHATPEGYRCRSITLERPDGSIDYGAFRLTPIEEVLRSTAGALLMVAPDGGTFAWPDQGAFTDLVRARTHEDRATRDAYAVQIHALAAYAGLPARETARQALGISTATTTKILTRTRSDGTYPTPYATPRPLDHLTTAQAAALQDMWGSADDEPRIGDYEHFQEA